MDRKLSNKQLDLADHIGAFIEYWGFKKVHGRIWTLIFLSPAPIDANFIIEQLDISKALASMSIKDLLYYNVIFEVEKDKPGTQKYTYNPDIINVVLDVLDKREKKMISQISQTYNSMKRHLNKKQDAFVCDQRFNELGGMITMADLVLSSFSSGETVQFETLESALSLEEN